MDIATISGALGSIKAATDIAKLIRNSNISLQDAEVKLKLADLISTLADAKIEMADIQADLIRNQEKISELENKLKLKEDVTWDEPYYWLGAAKEKNGPYCQKCFDGEQKLIRLQGNGSGYWDCKQCTSSYTDASYDSGGYASVSSSRWDDF